MINQKVKVIFKGFSIHKSRGNLSGKDNEVVIGTVIKETDKQLKIRDEKGTEWTIRKVNLVSCEELVGE